MSEEKRSYSISAYLIPTTLVSFALFSLPVVLHESLRIVLLQETGVVIDSMLPSFLPVIIFASIFFGFMGAVISEFKQEWFWKLVYKSVIKGDTEVLEK